MIAIVRTFLLLACVCSGLSRAATVELTVMDLGNDLYRLEYLVTGHEFLKNQEFAIEFDPDAYLALENATGPAGFDILLFQPDDPPGTVGRLSALALVDFTAASGVFSVDVQTVANNSSKGPVARWEPAFQAFAISQLDDNGTITSTIAEGTVSFTPETGTWQLSVVGMLILFVHQFVRRLITSG